MLDTSDMSYEQLTDLLRSVRIELTRRVDMMDSGAVVNPSHCYYHPSPTDLTIARKDINSAINLIDLI